MSYRRLLCIFLLFFFSFVFGLSFPFLICLNILLVILVYQLLFLRFWHRRIEIIFLVVSGILYLFFIFLCLYVYFNLLSCHFLIIFFFGILCVLLICCFNFVTFFRRFFVLLSILFCIFFKFLIIKNNFLRLSHHFLMITFFTCFSIITFTFFLLFLLLFSFLFLLNLFVDNLSILILFRFTISNKIT